MTFPGVARIQEDLRSVCPFRSPGRRAAEREYIVRTIDNGPLKDGTAIQRGYENLDNERPKDQCEILKRKKNHWVNFTVTRKCHCLKEYLRNSWNLVSEEKHRKDEMHDRAAKQDKCRTSPDARRRWVDRRRPPSGIFQLSKICLNSGYFDQTQNKWFRISHCGKSHKKRPWRIMFRKRFLENTRKGWLYMK